MRSLAADTTAVAAALEVLEGAGTHPHKKPGRPPVGEDIRTPVIDVDCQTPPL
jgi:hypothetical protein